MPEQKIDLNNLIATLKDDVLSVEQSNDPQREKTRHIQAAAKRFMNALYFDQRKYKGISAQQRRISLSSLNSYLSRTRRVFEQLGLRHHLLDRDLARMKNRYPFHANQISELENLPPVETRLKKKVLSDQLANTKNLLENLHRIDFSSAQSLGQIEVLKKEHPRYSELLCGLLGSDAAVCIAQLEKGLGEVSGLLDDLIELKVNHEVMYHLVMPKAERTTHTNNKDKALEKKRRTVQAIDYPTYLQRIYSLLTNPTITVGGDGTRYGIAPLSFAIAAATGRRPIEVLIQGEFRLIDQYRLGFQGQAKRRLPDENENIIYSIVDANIIIDALQKLRSLPQVVELREIDQKSGDTRRLNELVNSRTAAPFNRFAKSFFNDNSRVFKDVRSIYARICYERWFNKDPRWSKKNDDVFFTELLGHDSKGAQMHYKSFKLHRFNSDFEPEKSNRSSRLERLSEFDSQMPALARSDAAVKIHQKVKDLLLEQPDLKINQSVISKATDAFRGTIKNYMNLTADALGIELNDKGRWKQKDIVEDPVMVEIDEDQIDGFSDDSIDDVNEADSVEQAVEKPRYKYRLIGDNEWAVQLFLGDDEVAHVTGKGPQFEIMQQAWAEYEASLNVESDSSANPVVTSCKNGSDWDVTISVDKRTVYQATITGSKRTAEKAALNRYLNTANTRP